MADNQVEQVKQKTDIVSLIDARVKLTKAGRNYKALCPFHGEKTPSFFVSPELQTFKCFGCGESGDAFTFLEKYEGMTFPEALEFLAQKAGIKLKREYRTGDEKKRERLLEVLHLTAEYYHFLLTEHKVGAKAVKYLIDRGIGKQLIKKFLLGYSPDSWDGLQKYLVGKKKYSHEELVEAGLTLKRSGRGGYYDRFRGRLMFPLTDMRGRVLGFAGRVLPGEEVDENQAKYINSPETKLYHKSKLLYGLDISRSEIRKKDRAVVVEGELDMVSSYKAGVGETVAIKGSALTEDQVTLLRRLTNNLVLALDADAAGSEATKRGIAIADKMGMNLLVAEVTGGKDPDEVAQKDSQLWRNLVNKPKSIYDYLIDKAVQAHGTGTGEGKKKITNELAPILANINHVVERDHYVKKLANLLSVTENVLETEISKAEIVGDESSNQTKEPEAMGRKERIERYLVSLFLQMDKDYKKNLDLVDSDWITHEGIGELWQNFTQKVGSKKDKKIKDMVASLPKEKQRLVESLFTVEAIEFKGDQDRLNKAFLRGVDELKNLYKKEKMEALSEKIGLLEGKEKLTLAQEKQLTKLQNDFSQIAKG